MPYTVKILYAYCMVLLYGFRVQWLLGYPGRRLSLAHGHYRHPAADLARQLSLRHAGATAYTSISNHSCPGGGAREELDALLCFDFCLPVSVQLSRVCS